MMARAGIDDLLVANEVVGDEKIQCLAENDADGADDGGGGRFPEC